MNKKTLALTQEQYNNIIRTMKMGFNRVRPNRRVAVALVLEAESGAKISDILKLKKGDFGSGFSSNLSYDFSSYYRYYFFKSKEKTFVIPYDVYEDINNYCSEHGIRNNNFIFSITARSVQKHLKIVCDYLGCNGISTHSFRKYFAQNIYENNQHRIDIVQKRLNHAFLQTTKKYIDVDGATDLNTMNENCTTEEQETKLEKIKKYISCDVKYKEKTVEYKLEGHTISETSEMFKVPISTVKRWLKQYREFGHLEKKPRQ